MDLLLGSIALASAPQRRANSIQRVEEPEDSGESRPACRLASVSKIRQAVPLWFSWLVMGLHFHSLPRPVVHGQRHQQCLCNSLT